MNKLSKISIAGEIGSNNLFDELKAAGDEKTSGETISLEELYRAKRKKKGIFKNLGDIKWLKADSLRKFASHKNTLVACCVLLIGLAVYLNFLFTEKADAEMPIDTAGGKILGETSLVDSGDQNMGEENYFAVAVINRQRVRDEAIDMLQEVVDSVETNSSVRENAYSEMTRMAKEISSEINIENLVLGKGFQECIAVVSGDCANIIVKTEGLMPEQVAQIKEIVFLEAGTPIDNIKIFEKS